MADRTEARASDETTGKEQPPIRAVALMKKGIESRVVAALADQVIFNAGNFLRGVILARMVSQGEFGLFTLGWTIISFLFSVTTTLVSTPYSVYCPRLKGAELARYTGSALFHLFFLVISLTVVGIGTSLSFALMGDSKEISVLAWSITIVVAPILLRDHIRRLCIARLWMRAAIAVDLSTVIVQLGLLLAVGAIAGLSAATVFVVIGSGCLLVTLPWLAMYRREFIVSRPQVLVDWRTNWLLGRWGLASAVLYLFAVSLYPWILAALHGTDSAGIWAACIGVVALGNPLLLGLQNYFLPKASHIFAEGGASALRSFVTRAALLMGGSVTVLCVILVPIGGWLVSTIYGDSYSGNGLVVALLLANFSILSFSVCFARGIFILERADIDFKINIVSIIFVFSIGIWMVKEIGVTGAALSMLIGHFFSLVLLVVLFFRISGEKSLSQSPQL